MCLVFNVFSSVHKYPTIQFNSLLPFLLEVLESFECASVNVHEHKHICHSWFTLSSLCPFSTERRKKNVVFYFYFNIYFIFYILQRFISSSNRRSSENLLFIFIFTVFIDSYNNQQLEKKGPHARTRVFLPDTWEEEENLFLLLSLLLFFYNSVCCCVTR